MIENPQRAPVRGEEHRVVARVEHDLVDANAGQIAPHTGPRLCPIGRNEEARFRAEIQHVLIFQVFSDRFDDLTGEIPIRRSPALTEVVADEDVGLEIVLPMIVNRDVDRPLIET